MDLLIIRHAIAEPRVEDGGTEPDDTQRALTPNGRQRMKRGARGLYRLHPGITLLASSPLVRARQTAEIVARAYGGISITTVPELATGVGVESMAAWLRSVESAETVAVVGHEPGLGELGSWLLGGSRAQPFITLGKGGACLVQLPEGAPAGEGRLAWHATPKMLRRLGRG